MPLAAESIARELALGSIRVREMRQGNSRSFQVTWGEFAGSAGRSRKSESEALGSSIW